jgi:hypothetical protein
MTLKPEWRQVLELRSTKDKLAVPIDDLGAGNDAVKRADETINEMVREGLIVWIDKAFLPWIGVIRGGQLHRAGINCDIYQITLKGIRVCNENGIKQR